MNIKLGKITQNEYKTIFKMIKEIPCSRFADDTEKACYVEIMYKLLSKMQNKIFQMGNINSNIKIAFSLSATEAWAIRKIYYNSVPVAKEVMQVHLSFIISKIERCSINSF